MKAWQFLILLLALVGSSTSVVSQDLTLTILSNPSITINSASAYTNGVTVSNTTVRTTVRRNFAWSLSVRASSANLTNGSLTIPVNQVKMQVTNTNITNTPLVTLSTTAQTLASDLSVVNLDRTTNLSINYILSGGANLLKTGGNYSTTLTFTMTLL